jgi:conjugative transfer protein TraD
MVTDPWRQDQATARATLRKAAAEAARRGAKLRLDQQTAALILRATGAADLDPETLIGLLVSNLEQATLAPVLTATWRERGEAALQSQVQAP